MDINQFTSAACEPESVIFIYKLKEGVTFVQVINLHVHELASLLLGILTQIYEYIIMQFVSQGRLLLRSQS